jgi:hypothetical protein
MKLTWLKGPYTWIASLPDKAEPPNKNFKRSAPPPKGVVVQLCMRLIELGGHTVCIGFNDEPGSAFFLQQSAITPFRKLQLKSGKPNQCHVNSALLWHKNRKRYQLATGYALSPDGLWRRHSWVLHRDDIIETTEARTQYFGVVLDDEQAEAFHKVYNKHE